MRRLVCVLAAVVAATGLAIAADGPAAKSGGAVMAANGPAAPQDSSGQPLTAAEQRGKEVYESTCVYCHGAGGWGTNKLSRRFEGDQAYLAKRTGLPEALIRTAVRVGINGMPPYRRTEVTDADLDALVAFLTRQDK